jgi:hypothetical protein
MLESRTEKVGGGEKVAVHGLDPGIPAGMTAEWVLSCVLIRPAGTILCGESKRCDEISCLLSQQDFIPRLDAKR